MAGNDNLNVSSYVLGSMQAIALSTIGVLVDQVIHSLDLDDTISVVLQLGFDAVLLGLLTNTLDDSNVAPSTYVGLSMFLNVQSNLYGRINRLATLHLGASVPQTQSQATMSKKDHETAAVGKRVSGRADYEDWHHY